MSSHPTPPSRIVGSCFVLRPWTAADVPALTAAVRESRSELREWMAWADGDVAEPVYRAFVDASAAAWRDGGGYVYGVLAPDDRTVLGGTGLHLREGPDTFEIGYWIHSAHTGQGLASEVTRLLTDTAVSWPGIERVVVAVDVANERSASVPARLGFVPTETVPVVATARRSTGLHHHYEMTHDQWREDPTLRRSSEGGIR